MVERSTTKPTTGAAGSNVCARSRRPVCAPEATSTTSSNTVHNSEAMPAPRFSLWYRAALSSFTGGRIRRVAGRFAAFAAAADPNAAVGGLQVDRRAAAVHVPFEPATRTLGDIHF